MGPQAFVAYFGGNTSAIDTLRCAWSELGRDDLQLAKGDKKMPRFALACAAAAIVTASLAAGYTAAAVGHPVFYLTVHPKQCLIGGTNNGNKNGKTVTIVPCSDPNHNLEVYALGHGGWGHATPPSTTRVLAVMRTICLAAFQRLTGRPLGRTQGWNGFAPDPGSETARYGDKIICSFRT